MFRDTTAVGLVVATDQGTVRSLTAWTMAFLYRSRSVAQTTGPHKGNLRSVVWTGRPGTVALPRNDMQSLSFGGSTFRVFPVSDESQKKRILTPTF